jgi:SNF2 family DNA or RNA helicase
VRIDGTVARIEDRVEAVRRFQEDPNVRIFLGNAAAAGAGITLTAARHAVYESLSNQAAHWLQSLDRIHRRGQQRDVVCHVLVAERTLEEREFERLRHKEQAARELLGDDYEEPPTRERFLAELDWCLARDLTSSGSG